MEHGGRREGLEPGPESAHLGLHSALKSSPPPPPLAGSPFPDELLGGGLAVLPQWLSLHLTSPSRGTVGSQHRWTTSWE